MKFDFVTIGGATEDITLYTDEGVMINNPKDITRQKLIGFEYGAKLRIEKSKSTFGGGAANAAVNFANLGFRTVALVALGDDIRGDSVLKNFKNRKVNTSLIQRVKKQETGFTFFVVCPDGEHVGFSSRAANQFLKVGPKEIKVLRDTKWAYVTSLSGAWKSLLDKVFSAKNLKVAWNPGSRQIEGGFRAMQRYLKKTSILQMNKDEAIGLVLTDPEYTRANSNFLNDTKNLLQIIKQWGPEIVQITEGKFGSSVYDGQKFYHQNILAEKKRIDTTGVGDCFGSTFVAALQYTGGDIQKAMYLGAKNTASVIGQPGAQNGLLSKKQLFKK